MNTKYKKLVLEPVIELEPIIWVGEKITLITDINQRSDYWEKFLSQYGAKPISAGSWFIPLRYFKNLEFLRQLIVFALDESGIVGYPDDEGEETYDIEDRLPPLSGGYALMDKNRVFYEPQCCCDLMDITEWDKIYQYQNQQWLNIVMGHCLLNIKYKKNQIYFLQTEEYSDKEIKESFKQEDVKIAVLKSYEKIESFYRNVLKVVSDMILDKTIAKAVAQKLTGIERIVSGIK